MLAQVVQRGCLIPGNQKPWKSLNHSLRIPCSQEDVCWKLEEKQNKSLLLLSGGKHWNNNSNRSLNEKRNLLLSWFLQADKQESHYMNFSSTLSTLWKTTFPQSRDGSAAHATRNLQVGCTLAQRPVLAGSRACSHSRPALWRWL